MIEPRKAAHERPIELCCLLWARPGLAAELSRYEDVVLAFLPDHGGVLLQRAISTSGDDAPHEVQLYRFPNGAALDASLADPRRRERSAERDRVVARTTRSRGDHVCVISVRSRTPPGAPP